MARMLEALDVQPGQRVLEIGTGSGYNAALLATLTGEASQVVTIERDAELASTAGEALERVLGPGMTVIVEDGVMGWPPGAPYDRIIATASAPTLPMAWVEQLRPNGTLVMDLQGTLASGFLVVEKTATRVSGHFLPEPLHFMPLETEAITMPHTKLASLLQQGCQATFTQKDDAAFPVTLLDPAFRWFVQWRIPGCQVSKRKQLQRDTGSVIHSILVIEPRSQALVRFQKHQEEAGWRGEVYILRADFRLVETVSRQEMIMRTLPFIRSNVQRNPEGPEVYGGVRALGMLVQTLRTEMPDHLASHLLYFALPLAIRRTLDAQAFLVEGNRPEAARLLEQQARLLGQAQYPGVQHEWSSVAALIEQVATLEERFIAVCASW
jgi:protein-L-isoaspartate O-methyltransferase